MTKDEIEELLHLYFQPYTERADFPHVVKMAAEIIALRFHAEGLASRYKDATPDQISRLKAQSENAQAYGMKLFSKDQESAGVTTALATVDVSRCNDDDLAEIDTTPEQFAQYKADSAPDDDSVRLRQAALSRVAGLASSVEEAINRANKSFNWVNGEDAGLKETVLNLCSVKGRHSVEDLEGMLSWLKQGDVDLRRDALSTALIRFSQGEEDLGSVFLKADALFTWLKEG